MWVSREFEQQLDFQKILDEYGVAYTHNHTHFVLKKCPFCDGRNKFFIDKRNKKWVCFKCVKTDDFSNKEGRGNLITFLRKVLNLSEIEIRSIIKDGEAVHFTDPDMFFRASSVQKEEKHKLESMVLPSSFIQLDCTVDSLRQHIEAYRYLMSRHVTDANIIRSFDIRYNPHHKRIIFPIYSDRFTIVGWQARDITDRWKKDHPKCPNQECELRSKYYFIGEEIAPTNCPKCGSALENEMYPKSRNSTNFPKTLMFFNQHHVDWDSTVAIVEGPFDCINTPNSIAMLGKALSKEQLNILLEKAKKLVIYLDGDEAGKFSTAATAKLLAPFFSDLKVYPWVQELDPGSFSRQGNIANLSHAISAEEWLHFHSDF